MPIYEYLCGDCQQRVELLVRSDETPECPECGSARLEKQLSVVAAHSTQGRNDLPISPSGGCGRPQCGTGGCQFE